MSYVLKGQKLYAAYPAKTVLTDLNFTLDQPGIYGLIGANGVGKTTLIKIIAGQLRAASPLDSITLNGEPTFNNPAAMQHMCLMGADTNLPEHFQVANLISFAADRWNNWDQARADELLARFGVTITDKYRNISRGQKTAVQIILAFASGAPVTLIDEPSLGLDMERRALLYKVIAEEKARLERIIIISTHQLDESSTVLDQILVLADQRLAFQAEVEDLNSRVLMVSGTQPAIQAFLDAHSLRILRQQSEFGQAKAVVVAEKSTDLENLWYHAGEVKLQAASLETAVLALLGRQP